MTSKKPTKKTKTEEDKLADFLVTHTRNILWCGNLSKFDLRKLYEIGKSKAKKRMPNMEIAVDHTYLEFDLGYDKELMTSHWKDKKYSVILQILCHELTHILTTEADIMLKFKSSTKDRDYYFERLTEHTSRWLFRIYEDFMENRKIDIKTGLIKG